MKSFQKIKVSKILIIMLVILIVIVLSLIIMQRNELVEGLKRVMQAAEEIEKDGIQCMVYDNTEEDIKVLVSIQRQEGIDSIEYIDSLGKTMKLECYGKKEVSLDTKMKLNTEYQYKVTSNNEEEIETIKLDENYVKDYIRVIDLSEEATEYKRLEIEYVNEDETTKQYYKVGNTGDWKEYTENIVILSRDINFEDIEEGTNKITIYAKIIDRAGNVVEIQEKCELPYSIYFTYNTIRPTNGNVEVEIQTAMNGYTLQYSMDGTTWEDYTESIIMEKNGEIYARLKDSEGQTGGYVTGNVGNIDKLAPKEFAPTAESTTNSITIKGETEDQESTEDYTSSGVEFYYFSIDGGETWTERKQEATYTFNNLNEGSVYKVKMKAEDKAGNITETGILTKVTNSTETKTTFKYTPTTPTKENVAVKIETPLAVEGMELQYSIDGGNTWIDYTKEVIMEKNGEIYTRIKDSSGQVGNYAIGKVENIDKLAPKEFAATAESTTNSITIKGETEDQEVTEDYASSEILTYYYSKDDGQTWEPEGGQEETSYTFKGLNEGTEYKLKMKAVDEAGNETKTETITQSTKEVVDLTETNTKFIYDPTGWTNNDVTVEIKTNEEVDLEGMTLQYSIDEGNTWADYKVAIIMEKNGEIYARLIDTTGQIGGYVTGNVGNIDKLAPKEFTPAITSTTSSITIKGETEDQEATEESGSSGILAYYYSKDDGQTWEPEGGQKETSYTFEGLSEGTEYNLKMKAVDEAGNGTITETITQSTKVVVDLTETNTEFIYSPTDWTNDNVTVEIKPKEDVDLEGMTLQYSTDEGNTWVAYKEAITMEKNGDIYARVIDTTGQIGEQIVGNVANIDRLPPGEFTPTITSTTNSITIEAEIEDANKTEEYGSSGIARYYFSNDGGETWLPENGQKNGSYTFGGLKQGTEYTDFKMKAVDVAGNETTTESISGRTTNVAASGADFNYSPEEWTNGDVTVEIKTDVDLEGLVLQYSIDGGNTWTDYTEVITMEQNGAITAALRDNTYQRGETTTVNITNIDKLAPKKFIPTTTTTTNSITVTGVTEDAEKTEEDESSGIAKYYFSNDGGETWLPENGQENGSYTFGGLEQTKEYTGFMMKVVDNAGNETVSETVTGVTKTVADLTENHIEFTYNPSTWTNGDVEVTIAKKEGADFGEFTLQYSIDGGDTWTDYTEAITMEQNGAIMAALRDDTYQRGKTTATGNVTNIDRTKPTIGEFTATDNGNTVTLKATTVADKGGSGLKGYIVQDNSTAPTTNSKWTSSTSATISYTANLAGTYYIWVIDNAGNISAAKSCTVSAVASIGTTNYTTLANAVSAGTTSTIKLLVNRTESVTIPTTKNITLQLNSKTLTGTIINNGTLTVSGGTIQNNGARGIYNAGTLKTSATISSTNYQAVFNSGTATVTGGTISSTGTVVTIGNNKELILSGGTITTKNYWAVATSESESLRPNIKTTVSGATIKALSGAEAGGIYAYGTFNMTSGTVTSAGGDTIKLYEGTSTITGGKVESTYLGDAIRAGANSKLTISGTNTIVSSNGYYTTDTEGNIEDASKTISIVDTATVTISGGKISNTNYSTIHQYGNLTVSGGTISAPTRQAIYNYGTTNITGGTLESAAAGFATVVNKGTVTISGNSTIENTGGSAVYAYADTTTNIKGGTITASGVDEYGVGTDAGATINITGGTIQNTNKGKALKNEGTVTINGTEVVIKSNSTDRNNAVVRNYDTGTVTFMRGRIQNTSTGYAIYTTGTMTQQESATTVVGLQYGGITII